MDFYKTVIQCASPALCGIKPSCLFSLNEKDFNTEYDKILALKEQILPFGKHVRLIKRNPGLYLLFIYDGRLLENLLSSRSNQLYLLSKGYSSSGDSKVLIQELLFRLEHSKAFPHEIGLFLGYPIEDVISFEKDGGRKSLYTGLWQVYSDVEQSFIKMQDYRNCTAFCSRQLMNGMDIPLIIKNYEYMEAC